MGIFLQILGAIVLVVLLLIAAVVAFFFWQIAKMKRLAKIMGGPVAPVRVHLVDAPEFSWSNPRAVSRLQAEFEAAGFTSAGTFGVREIPVVGMIAFAKNDESAYGVITEHPVTGVFAEVVRSFADGRMHTVTQAKSLDKNPSAPYKTLVRRPGASVADLMRELDALPDEGERIAHTAEGFSTTFENAYHRDMTWAYTEGPNAGTDVDPIASLVGQEPDAETAAFLRGLNPEEVEEDEEEKVRAAFLAQTDLSAAEWEEMRDEVVFIHDGLDDDDLIDLLIDWVDYDEDEHLIVGKLNGANARDRFVGLLDRLDLIQSFVFIGSIDEPVPCNVYRYASGTA